MRGKKIRALACGAGIVGASLLAAPAAFATTAVITPATQSHSYGTLSTWSAVWSGQSSYKVSFAYGDGGSFSLANTTTTSANLNHHFYPCTSTTYTQQLKIYQPGSTFVTASGTSTSRETGGSGC